MSRTSRYLATSDHGLPRLLRRVRRAAIGFSLPAPGVVARPMLWAYLGVRSVYYFACRVFIAEPLLKAYCTRYGRRLKTDIYVHWIQGKGTILLGDDVSIVGKCSFKFAARYVDDPTLIVGNRTGIGSECRFTVGKRITIGDDCRIAGGVWVFDSSGHPSDPEARLAGLPAPDDEVRPVTIGDNVWIGGRAIIHPGVTIGSGSIVSAGAVVLSDVPPRSIVAGNPARRIGTLAAPLPENGQLRPAEAVS